MHLITGFSSQKYICPQGNVSYQKNGLEKISKFIYVGIIKTCNEKYFDVCNFIGTKNL